MKRVVIVGRGAAGKSTLALRLGTLTGLPVIELDTVFWRPGLTATPPEEWAATQRELARRPAWIMDGDLGPYDVLNVRLRAADTVIMLDFPLLTCAWRARRRGRERADFWHWLWTYRRRWGRHVLRQIEVHARDADVHVLRSQRAVDHFLARVAADETAVRPPCS
ncbi:adenylate kinase [Thermasporomyces composti]|jgi:adenylate kinase family enzyme|uniref:Adenylate kinase family enzyme n=1 Tax=Thermasporomyces composti TaxID=696763 RepID=A0A3D9V8H0_THECX|nr:adenylate kinase [Thermasporomyces composti]REF38072.1 adenylate kinase family enzyme [Thermasporomyces composti]